MTGRIAVIEFYSDSNKKYIELGLDVVSSNKKQELVIEGFRLYKIVKDNRKNRKIGESRLTFSMGELEKIRLFLEEEEVTSIIIEKEEDRELIKEILPEYDFDNILSLSTLMEKLFYNKRRLEKESSGVESIRRKFLYASELAIQVINFADVLSRGIFMDKKIYFSNTGSKIHLNTCRYYRKGQQRIDELDYLSNDFKVCQHCIDKSSQEIEETSEKIEVVDTSLDTKILEEVVEVEETIKNNPVLEEVEGKSNPEEKIEEVPDSSQSKEVLNSVAIVEEVFDETDSEEEMDTRSEIERLFFNVAEQDSLDDENERFVKVYTAGTNLEDRAAELKLKRDATHNMLKYYEYDSSYLAAELGLFGEDKLLEELQYSFMEMIVIKDITLQYTGLFAQIDFLVITKKAIYILEAKNYIGDVSIDIQRNFVRYTQSGPMRVGNPLNQIERQVNILKQLKKSKYRKEAIYGLLVLTSDDTTIRIEDELVLDGTKVINVDNVIRFIKKNEESLEEIYTLEEMEDIAKFLLDRNKSKGNVYNSQERAINERILRNNLIENIFNKKEVRKKKKSLLAAPLKKSTKEFEDMFNNYLMKKAKKKNISEQRIMTDSMKEEIFREMPETKEKLQKLMVKNSFYYGEIENDIVSMINQELKK